MGNSSAAPREGLRTRSNPSDEDVAAAKQRLLAVSAHIYIPQPSDPEQLTPLQAKDRIRAQQEARRAGTAPVVPPSAPSRVPDDGISQRSVVSAGESRPSRTAFHRTWNEANATNPWGPPQVSLHEPTQKIATKKHSDEEWWGSALPMAPTASARTLSKSVVGRISSADNDNSSNQAGLNAWCMHPAPQQRCRRSPLCAEGVGTDESCALPGDEWRTAAAPAPYTEPRDSRPAESECIICMAAPRDCVILSCGHIAACYVCAMKLSSCPVCRGSIASVVRTFHA